MRAKVTTVPKHDALEENGLELVRAYGEGFDMFQIHDEISGFTVQFNTSDVIKALAKDE